MNKETKKQLQEEIAFIKDKTDGKGFEIQLPELEAKLEGIELAEKYQECCICGKMAECNQVWFGHEKHFRCCSRECLNKLFEHEKLAKQELIREISGFEEGTDGVFIPYVEWQSLKKRHGV